MAIFVCSDWHFMHQKSFLYEPRGFKTVEEMNEAIIQRHNEVVGPNDEVFHLGDEIMSDIDRGIKCIKRLNGRIHLIRGNHSTDNKLARIVEECPNVVEYGKWSDVLQYKKWRFYLSHYPTICGNFDDGDKPLKKRMINLCGHRHVRNKFMDMDKGLIYHCELDCQKNMPIKIDKIIEDIQNFFDLDVEERKKIISLEKYDR